MLTTESNPAMLSASNIMAHREHLVKDLSTSRTLEVPVHAKSQTEVSV
jgi:hypothetical protein